MPSSPAVHGGAGMHVESMEFQMPSSGRIVLELAMTDSKVYTPTSMPRATPKSETSTPDMPTLHSRIGSKYRLRLEVCYCYRFVSCGAACLVSDLILADPTLCSLALSCLSVVNLFL